MSKAEVILLTLLILATGIVSFTLYARGMIVEGIITTLATIVLLDYPNRRKYYE